ncbi:MAG: hypothetical protein AAF543_17645, partial [Pseudomonadota bacterium]
MADPFETFADRPDDDEVLLAPRLDFTPGGTSRGEGRDADIESPFAEPEQNAVPELMSPVRGAADSRMADSRMNASPYVSGSSPKPAPDIDLSAVLPRMEPPRPARPRPARVGPASRWAEGQATGFELDIAPEPAAGDIEGYDPAPFEAGAQRDARLRVAAGALTEAGSSLLKGAVVAWAAYSRLCLRCQTWLSHLTGRCLAHGQVLLGKAVRELVRLGLIGLREGARWLGKTAVVLGKGTKAATVAGLALLSTVARQALAYAINGIRSWSAPTKQASAEEAAAATTAARTSEATSVPAAPSSADGDATEANETAQRQDAAPERQSMGFLPSLPVPRLAYAGFAAASVAMLFLAFGPNPAPAP